MNELALFAGAGGGILGGELLGWRCVCAVEHEAYAAGVLLQRQNDGVLPAFPVWDDVRTFDGRPWRGIVDVVSGGFPCQDISAAGKGAGIEGERSGLWVEMARIIGEVRPRYAFVENSPVLTSRGLGNVLGDLAALGYDARWGVLGAHDIGAPHKRARIWIVADAKLRRVSVGRGTCDSGPFGGFGSGVSRDVEPFVGEQAAKGVADSTIKRCQGYRAPRVEELGKPYEKEIAFSGGSEDRVWWATEPDVGRVAHGVAARVDRLKAIGNGQVPAVAALAWRILTEDVEQKDQ